jgi:hypothetical protein
MKRATLIYGLVLAVLLGFSWCEWTSETEVDRGDKVELLAGSAEDIVSIEWKGDKSESKLTRMSDAHGDYIWVDSTRWTKKPVVKPAAEDGEPVEVAEPERLAKHSVFKASAKADTLMDSFSPFLALRRLEVSSPEKLEEIGLQNPEATLEVVRGGTTQTLDIGGEAYGSRHIYVRRRSDGHVYLVEREQLQGLRYARSRLADHSLIGIKRSDLVQAVITLGDASLQTTQKNGDDAAQAVWVLTEDEESAPEQLTTWMGQAIKLKGMRYSDPTDPPADLQSRLSIELTGPKGRTETLELLQVGQGGDWYARSEHTRGLVKLVRSAAKSLWDDAQSVLDSAG